MESILTSIKKTLGIAADYTQFDDDLVIHINSVLFILSQLGVGTSEGFSITDDSTTWGDLIQDSKNLEAIKTYVGLRVKMLFDPPLSAAVIESYNSQIRELEWRINVTADNSNSGEE